MNAFRLFPKYRFPVSVPASRPCPANVDDASRSAVDVSTLRQGALSAGGPGVDVLTRVAPREWGGQISVVLADDHPVVRNTVKRLLHQHPDLLIAGESANGLDTLSLIKRVQPDLLVTDLMMPGLNGLEVIRRVRMSYPATRIVVLSVSGDEPYVTAAFRCGANAFVFKPSCGRYLLPALRAALSGRRFVSPPLVEPAN